MKTYALVFIALALLFMACEPEPVPELRDQIHGQWRLSVDGYVRYNSNLGYSFYYPTGIPLIPWQITIAADGTAIIKTDSTYHTSWQHLDRDHLSMQIPAGILLPNLGSWECRFLKYENFIDSQYLMGNGNYVTDTAVVNDISIEMNWSLDRIQ